MFERPPLDLLVASLERPSNPVGMRMRAVYYLRQAYEESNKNSSNSALSQDENGIDSLSSGDCREMQLRIIDVLGRNLRIGAHGSLLRHELAYVMGQLRDVACCNHLETVVVDDCDCAMVRHECAEALGAIGAYRSIGALERLTADERPEVSETCQIAIDFIRWKTSRQFYDADEEKVASSKENDTIPPLAVCACMLSPYSSVDPAPPMDDGDEKRGASEVGNVLRDERLPLFERYRAMFTLRNLNTSESAIELGNVLITDRSSALLRHEVAYVLGQMQNTASFPMLVASLRNLDEHSIVRHESAEALGAMCDVGETVWVECEAVLREFMSDNDEVVRESCVVALDAADYWADSGDGFGYAQNHLQDAPSKDA